MCIRDRHGNNLQTGGLGLTGNAPNNTNNSFSSGSLFGNPSQSNLQNPQSNIFLEMGLQKKNNTSTQAPSNPAARQFYKNLKPKQEPRMQDAWK
eukprot:TRINITY_DN21503_c0_g1_i1.p3 TRINITY_DN21503_c0_g1~~TRINITY_DN21503_c0_g1_i1.p3  ORF type:complete len:110 (+),score=26.74 TRINITY_DN21503_c0_g1_i1:51-332(+)